MPVYTTTPEQRRQHSSLCGHSGPPRYTDFGFRKVGKSTYRHFRDGTVIGKGSSDWYLEAKGDPDELYKPFVRLSDALMYHRNFIRGRTD